ncbi:MAG: HEAT repeat domain-containing protein [Blastocatellia bacterium]
MRRVLVCVSIIIILSVSGKASAQKPGFISMEGRGFKSGAEEAAQKARSAGQAAFWMAYAFDVRPGVEVDSVLVVNRARNPCLDLTSVTYGVVDRARETRKQAVFFLSDVNTGAILQLHIFDLNKFSSGSDFPVYWLGRVDGEESLSFLRHLADSTQGCKVGELATTAIGMHEDARAASTLKDIIRHSSNQRSRARAAYWLGYMPPEKPLLISLVNKADEDREVRIQAALAAGITKEGESLPVLESLLGSVTDREVKKRLLEATSINENRNGSAGLLVKAANTDSDAEVRRQAMIFLAEKAAQHVSRSAYNRAALADGDAEVKKKAVIAIAQKPGEERVSLLLDIARANSDAEVRKQALICLGAIGDERALELFREILSQ